MTKILLIENPRSPTKSLLTELQANAYSVQHEPSVEAAIEHLKSESFELIITDVMFDGTSGIDGITLFRYLCPNVGVIVMTAYATIELAISAIKKGADEFLSKPVDTDTLMVLIRQVLQQHQPRSIKEERDDDQVFSALANPIRRAVIRQLKLYERVKFMDLCRLVEISDHTKFNFHLRRLISSGLVKKLNQKEYTLTALGKEICASSLFRQS